MTIAKKYEIWKCDYFLTQKIAENEVRNAEYQSTNSEEPALIHCVLWYFTALCSLTGKTPWRVVQDATDLEKGWNMIIRETNK